ncbi:hypothetical protein KVR01_011817 [Diaporthe batatas]|uniref:uncharacterized protein n=1 Tax=Diaporthe batatas TaxID=748121 RepID=UPI001D04A68F|nr:uncharacterized protein KVR01_011817 [Diaporthe batatas]KAG8158056.1 hypothetical protein KVR01_011817 [Diaporthe batatas]
MEAPAPNPMKTAARRGKAKRNRTLQSSNPSTPSTVPSTSGMSSPNPASDAAASPNQASGSKSFPSKTMSTVPKRWESQDLDLLRSGLFADAEISCSGFGGGRIRKDLSKLTQPDQVHRNILSARSGWFKKAFSGNYQERKDGRVTLEEGTWHVDLMLYFFYSGGIDLADNTLTAGRSVMKISIELIRLGGRFESKSMQDYGEELLATYLTELLDYVYDTGTTVTGRKARFGEQADFPALFCDAVRDVFSTVGPIESAQRILADFAFAARAHLFADNEFVALVEGKEVPGFGNLVLTAQIKGSVSDAFASSKTFKRLLVQAWYITR